MDSEYHNLGKGFFKLNLPPESSTGNIKVDDFICSYFNDFKRFYNEFHNY